WDSEGMNDGRGRQSPRPPVRSLALTEQLHPSSRCDAHDAPIVAPGEGRAAIRVAKALLPTFASGQLPWLGISGPLRKRLASTAGQRNVHLLLGRDAGANPFNGDDEHVFDFGRGQSPIGFKLKVSGNVCAGTLRYSSRPHGDVGPEDRPQLSLHVRGPKLGRLVRPAARYGQRDDVPYWVRRQRHSDFLPKDLQDRLPVKRRPSVSTFEVTLT